MSRARVCLSVGMAAIAVAGCGTAASAPTGGPSVLPASTAAHRVYLQTVQNSAPAIAIITVPGGKRDFLPDAVLSKDGTVAYSVSPKGGNTVVRALDATTGQERAEQTVSGTYSLPTPDVNPVPAGLSPNGRWLVLESQTPAPSQATPQTSRFAVVSTGLSDPVRQFELKGWYRFDAVDDDGSSLYVLDYLPGSKGDYQVRRLDMVKRVLDPTVIADKTELGKAMNGVRFAGFYSADGYWHLGLYGRTSGVAFVHALPMSASTPFAFCVDLPAKSSDIVTQMAWSAVETPDGARLYLANEELGELLELKIPPRGQFEAPQISRRAALPQPTAMRLPGVTEAQAKELPAQRLVLSPGGRRLYLASAHGIYVIDTATLTVRTRWLGSTSFSSLVISPDGTSLFATTVVEGTTQLDQVDSRTGGLITQTDILLTVLGLERVTSPKP